ncbi:MAG: alanine dehydrogenase [Alphaproteobacteria bacterium]
MLIGVPKEIKDNEFRVGMAPAGVDEVARHHGRKVLVQSGAGAGIGYTDEDYEQAGATVAATAEDVFEQADLIVKVKEPQPNERKMLREGQVLFTYLHLAPDPEQTKDLIDSNATCIAYETVTKAGGGLPLLAPMSEVAGRMSIQAGAHCLEKAHGGRGMLISGVPGVRPANVVILGGGVVGANAAYVAVGMGANVAVIDRNIDVMRALNARFGPSLKTVFALRGVIDEYLLEADLVIGAVLVPGADAPKLIGADIVKRMKRGAAIVDVAIDQGGCSETSRPTTHSKPTYVVDEVIHYCVTNMPGAVPHTSTYALNNATLPFVLALADKGTERALRDDEHLRNGLNIHRGQVTCKAVADNLGLSFVPALDALARG